MLYTKLIVLFPQTTILFAQPTKTSQLEPVMVQLTGDRLIVSQHDMVHEDILANSVSTNAAYCL